MGFPFVGEAFGFFTPHKSLSIGNFLQQRCSRYGKVFKSYIFGSPTIISCDLELNKFVLQKEGKLFQSSYPKPIRDILGEHSLMIVTDVERHKKLRRIEVGLINKFSSTSNFLGYETTSGLLSLLVYFLAQSPQALQTLKDEHLAIRKKKKEGEPLNWEDYKQMEFTTMVINETLRCGNLVKFVHREAIKDVKFKGYHIPAGWKVLPILSAVHLEPSLHENPSEFNPWRWTVVPFGGGSRLCPGSELGKLEASFLLHYLLLNYRWTMKEEEYPMLYPFMDFPKGLLIALETETTNVN
ncbi:hypothetical protein RDI58_006518 [Solanum bulbocastanum]|uniref:Cytochrome P450 n=1 Tax=Solanum bulbocastanum TaxID=147425 RepID=A0AAN8U2I9_SOLBU